MVALRMARYLASTRLLGALASQRPVARVGSEQRLTLRGVEVDRYANGDATNAQIVLLHGMTPRGARDHRLQRLARLLARQGATCWVPFLPNLARFAFHIADLEAIATTIVQASRSGPEKLGLVGFSVGGGYALRAAALPELADAVGYVMAVGAHHRLFDAWKAVQASSRTILERLACATDAELYAALVWARRGLTADDLGSALSSTLDTCLWGYCDGADLAAVRSLLSEDLGRHWPRLNDEPPCPQVDELSPAGKLAKLQADVALLHAPDDRLVPVSHAERNFAELESRLEGGQTLVVTRLLDHVRPRLGESLRDIPKLVGAFRRLL